MPAPDRTPPIKVIADATRFAKGIVDHYSAAEVDALLAAIPGGGTIPDAAITLHAGSVPDAGADTPQGLEDAFSVLADGLHYFKDVGTLVAIARQEYQTTIVLSGLLSSYAKIVKSEAGLPTTENPSLIVMQRAEGQWLKLTSDELDKPFGQPQRVDIFALTGGGADLTNYYNKPEVDAKVAALQQGVTDANLGVQSVADQSTFLAEQIGIQTAAKLDLKADKADTYTKKEVDDKIEADKDFSIANDNVLLASITSLQEIVSNLGGDIGTGQIDVLDAIRGVEIEPSMVTFSGDTTSPIAWKGGLSLTPVKEGDDWRLHWNDGKAIHTLVYGDEFTSANIVAALASQDVSVANLQTGGLELNELFMGAAGDRLITQVAGGPENTVAYLSDIVPPTPVDLSAYAKVQDNAQQLLAKTIVAQAVGFGGASEPLVALAYKDMGDGYGERLTLAVGLTNEYLVYKSDLDSLLPSIDTSQFSTTVTVAALDARINTLESTRATTTTTASLDTRIKSLESKSAATSNINDASNAALKKSILDAVALMLAGGTKQPPADIDWKACRNFGSGDHPTAQARMIGGVIELRGTLSYPSGTTGDQSFCRLPVGFPFAEFNTNVPAAAKVTSGSVAVAAYVTFSSLSANLGFDTASRANEVFLTGIKVKAAY